MVLKLATMNLTPSEEDGIKTILTMIPKWDLIPLVSTITNGLVKSTDCDDAIGAVLKYCKDSLDVLKRKRITKDVLFKYLKQSNVHISPKCDKSELISECLKHWQVSSISSETVDWEMFEIDNDDNDQSLRIGSQQPANFWTDERLKTMGSTFAKWFFDLLKDVNNDSIFGPQHFWLDCVFNTLIITPDGQSIPLCAQGSHQSCQTIRQTINDGQYQLEPNLYPDIKCEMDPHGLIRIGIDGIIYQHSQPIGVFETLFGLIKDPSSCDSTIWKIRSIEMKWRVNSFSNQPAICH